MNCLSFYFSGTLSPRSLYLQFVPEICRPPFFFFEQGFEFCFAPPAPFLDNPQKKTSLILALHVCDAFLTHGLPCLLTLIPPFSRGLCCNPSPGVLLVFFFFLQLGFLPSPCWPQPPHLRVQVLTGKTLKTKLYSPFSCHLSPVSPLF